MVAEAPTLIEAVPEAPPAPSPTSAAEKPPVVLPAPAARASVVRAARAVVEALDAHDQAKLAHYASREHGLDVMGSTNAVTDAPHFTEAELRDCARNRIQRVWISGEPRTTCSGYFARTLKGQAFSASVRVVFNGDADADANERAELRGRYDSAILVFQPEADAWRLTAIVGP